MNAPTALHLHTRIDGTLEVWRSADEPSGPSRPTALALVLEHTADLPTADQAALLRGCSSCSSGSKASRRGASSSSCRTATSRPGPRGLGPPDEVEPSGGARWTCWPRPRPRGSTG